MISEKLFITLLPLVTTKDAKKKSERQRNCQDRGWEVLAGGWINDRPLYKWNEVSRNDTVWSVLLKWQNFLWKQNNKAKFVSIYFL